MSIGPGPTAAFMYMFSEEIRSNDPRSEIGLLRIKYTESNF